MWTVRDELAGFCFAMGEGFKAVRGMLVPRAGSAVALFWVKILKALFTGSLTLGKSLNLSTPQFPAK